MKRRFFSGLIILLTSSICNAYDFNGCKVEEVVIGTDERNGHVKLDCEIATRPTCAINTQVFGFDRSTDTGMQIYSMMLMAYASNSKISGWVDDSSCPVWQTNISLLNGTVRVVK